MLGNAEAFRYLAHILLARYRRRNIGEIRQHDTLNSASKIVGALCMFLQNVEQKRDDVLRLAHRLAPSVFSFFQNEIGGIKPGWEPRNFHIQPDLEGRTRRATCRFDACFVGIERDDEVIGYSLDERRMLGREGSAGNS